MPTHDARRAGLHAVSIDDAEVFLLFVFYVCLLFLFGFYFCALLLLFALLLLLAIDFCCICSLLAGLGPLLAALGPLLGALGPLLAALGPLLGRNAKFIQKSMPKMTDLGFKHVPKLHQHRSKKRSNINAKHEANKEPK